MLEFLRNAEYLFIAITPRSLPDPLWSGVAAPNRVLSIGKKELFDI